MTYRNYEHQLLEALLHEHDARATAGSVVVTARRFKARQLTAAVIGTAAVTTAAVGFSILREDPRPDTSHAPLEGVTTVGDTDAALVVYRSAEAVAASTATILRAEHTTWASADATGPMSRTELWYDQGDPANVRVRYYGADGRPTIDEGFLRDGDLIHTREVDHLRGVVTEARAAETELAGEAPPALDVDPAKLTTALAAGELTLVGKETFAGVAVLHLRGSDSSGTRDIWVNAASYLPVRAEASGTFGSYRIEYEWVPRTDATLRDLLPAIPNGYHVAQ